MKFLLALICLVLLWSTPAFSQHDHGHQPAGKQEPATLAESEGDSLSRKQVAQLLSTYYNIKNALVSGDAASAAMNASEFLRTANAIDYKFLSESNVHILAKDAGRISTTRDLAKQRQHFVPLSNNMATIVKAVKPGVNAVYLQYCPMKKAYWLSAGREIRNPYYGSAMLTCGEVSETF